MNHICTTIYDLNTKNFVDLMILDGTSLNLNSHSLTALVNWDTVFVCLAFCSNYVLHAASGVLTAVT